MSTRRHEMHPTSALETHLCARWRNTAEKTKLVLLSWSCTKYQRRKSADKREHFCTCFHHLACSGHAIPFGLFNWLALFGHFFHLRLATLSSTCVASRARSVCIRSHQGETTEERVACGKAICLEGRKTKKMEGGTLLAAPQRAEVRALCNVDRFNSHIKRSRHETTCPRPSGLRQTHPPSER